MNECAISSCSTYSHEANLTPIIKPTLNYYKDVDWAAHLGGLLAGFAVSFLCFAPKIKTRSYAIFWTAVGLALNVVFYSTLVTYMLTEVEPMNDLNDICGYYKQFFDDYECQCQKE